MFRFETFIEFYTDTYLSLKRFKTKFQPKVWFSCQLQYQLHIEVVGHRTDQSMCTVQCLCTHCSHCADQSVCSANCAPIPMCVNTVHPLWPDQSVFSAHCAPTAQYPDQSVCSVHYTKVCAPTLKPLQNFDCSTKPPALLQECSSKEKCKTNLERFKQLQRILLEHFSTSLEAF